jgi:hypothetical protein
VIPRRSPLAWWALALLASACTLSEPPADLAIRNVTVIDAVGGVRPAQTVVVDAGRIVRVADASEAADATEVVDGTGRFLIPGLWDFHVHLTYDARFTEAMPALFLSHGITSVRDTGGPLERLVPVVQALRAEGAVAPRVFFAGPLMDGEDVVYDGVNNALLGIANPDVATARANVARLAEAGVDFVKIFELVTPEVFDVLVEEATSRGWPIAAHVPLSLRARDVGPRVQSLEHLRNEEMDCAVDAGTLVGERRRLLANPDGMPGSSLRSMLHGLQRLAAVAAYDEAQCAEVIAAMASTIQTPTLRLNSQSLRPPWDRPDWDAELAKLPPDVRADWGATTQERRRSTAQVDTTFAHWSVFLVGMMHEGGAPIGAGTDTPIGFAAPGYSLHSELEMLVRAGLSPLEAIEAATIRPAEFFGLDGEMGQVAEGYLADLVLLSADPLVDIDNSRAIEAVITKGVLLDRGELDALVR